MLKQISTQDLRTLAENAIELVKIVRQWLPVRGDTETKSGSQRTAEKWFYLAADYYTACERIRNPHKLHFDRRGAYYGPLSCSAAWFEIESALHEIAVAYSLQGVSDESGCPHLPFEQDVPAVESGTLSRLERAAVAILEAVHLEPAAAAKLPKPDRTEKIWFPQDVEERIRLELNCGGETEKLYLFATADELESLIGCDRKTAMKTAFWTQDRIALRQAWRRENNAKKLT